MPLLALAFGTARFWRILHYLLSGGVLLVWTAAVALLVRGRRFYRKLSAVPFSPEERHGLPRLSVLVPACNEADTVERAMQSLLAIDYPNLEIIAVNDRSTDATGAILDRMAKNNTRLRVRHVRELPPGWLGKNHAMHVASEEAEGDWLLFTDADVVFAPDTLRRAVAYACQRNVDLLVVSPRCETHGFWERLFISYFSLMFSFRVRPWEVADPKSKAFVGLGAFNMIRAEGYRHFGGHCALPMEVADDMKLGKVAKQNGLHIELLEGGDLISVRWMVGLRGVVEGLTKNSFAGLEFKPWAVLLTILSLAVTALYPVAALFIPGWPAQAMAALTLVVMVWGATIMGEVAEASRWYGLAYPLASLVSIYILMRSTWRTYRQHGILWRGTLYPLDELKRGIV